MKEVIRHNEDTATLKFQNNIGGFPGQFIMLNLYDHEEIPLSLSSPKSVTVRAIGETTNALIELEPGSIVGVKGPLGTSFSIPIGKSLIIAGGIGVAPLIYQNELLKSKDLKPDFYYGARTAEDIIYETENMQISTDDGSRGSRGTVIDLIESKKEEDIVDYSKIYCCGPEIMLKKLYNLFSKYNILNRVEFSIERHMRCGLGLCGSCSTDNGLIVCSEGPVFTGDQLDL